MFVFQPDRLEEKDILFTVLTALRKTHSKFNSNISFQQNKLWGLVGQVPIAKIFFFYGSSKTAHWDGS